MIVREYRWKHIPTGREGTASFTAYDAHEAGCTLYDGIPECYALVLFNKWNTSSEWKHCLRIEGGRGSEDFDPL